MRILYVPFFSSKNLGGCSIFNAMKVMLRGLVEQFPDTFLYYLVPTETEAFKVDALEYLDHPRILQIPVRGQLLQEDDMVYIAPEIWDLFNVDTGKYVVDMVLADKQRVSLWVKMMVNNGIRAVRGNVPLVNMSQFQGGSEETTGENHAEELLFSQVLGWYSGWNMWQCPAHLRDALKLARKYARPSVVDRIERRSYRGRGILISVDRLKPFLANERPRGQITLHYGSRFGSGYRYKELFLDVERLYRAGRKVKLVITSPSTSTGKPGGDAIKTLKKNGMDYELHCPCPQEMYYDIASRAHVSLWLCKTIGPSLGLREQAFLGQAIVAPDAPPYQSMLPKYPFLFKTEKQKQGYLRHVVENFWDDEVQEVIAYYRKHLEENHDIAAAIPSIREFMQTAIDEAAHTGGTEHMLQDVFDQAGWPEEIAFTELRKLVRKNTRIQRDMHANYSGTNRRNFVWGMRKLGYVDNGKLPEPVFVRVNKE